LSATRLCRETNHARRDPLGPKISTSLNEKLGYHEVPRGPIWDKIERVSLVKDLAQRIELVLLTPAYLRGEPVDLGFEDPHGFLDGADDVIALRLADLEANPRVAPWLLRAIVDRETRAAVGFIGFHGAPDPRGMVEVGYEVLPAFRRRWYAREALAVIEVFAAREGVRVVRASVSPENTASSALLERARYIHVGEQIDEIDGRELVYEKMMA
jgi:RimJ/RimL family protein N-acetyltransferase